MKHVILLAVALMGAAVLQSQGIYQLWGMTKEGGRDNLGTIFSTDAAGNNFKSRHSFKIVNLGGNPEADLSEYNGKLYGMTTYPSVIFEWDPGTYIYVVKYIFDTASGSNGSVPLGSLTLKDGKFYGMTAGGGIFGKGVIFQWDPVSNEYTKKIDFDGINGASPHGGLTLYMGKFYGTTSEGGNNQQGVIFEWDPATNAFIKRIDMRKEDGYFTVGNLALYGEKFYGMTDVGGVYDKGVLFEWDPANNNYTKNIDFDGMNGSNPVGSLTVEGGTLYGMTLEGGFYGGGVIFQFDPLTDTYNKRIDFAGNNGSNPVGRLTLKGEQFFGVTSAGGRNGKGVIFEWDPMANILTPKIHFDEVNGSSPHGLILSGSEFYGMTFSGGTANKGVIFKWDQETNAFAKKIDLNKTDGNSPSASLTYMGGKFYGMTNQSEENTGPGVIFEYDPITEAYTKRIEFGGINGADPTGNLTAFDGKFYGMTQHGGLYNNGVIFEWDPASNIYMKKFDFNAGGTPFGNLIRSGDKLYGTTQLGDIDERGVIFEWDPVTNSYTKRIEFDYYQSHTGLTLSNGKFYLVAFGNATEWDPVTNVYTRKTNFSFEVLPVGSLVEKNGKFYGMSQYGGYYGRGLIFEWDPLTDIITDKYDFDPEKEEGIYPTSSLTVSGSKLYGMTSLGGGFSGEGVIFEWDPATNVYNNKRIFDRTEGAHPDGNDLILAPAPVAKGLPGSCANFPSVTIDSTNNNKWVSITDSVGNAVAEIKANGNNLGLVSASMFTNNAGVREDGSKRLYLDRNITLTPQAQPATPVDIRLYIKNSEYVALRDAQNSDGNGPGIDSINDVAIYRAGGDCRGAFLKLINPVATSAQAWERDFVLSASISSFTSFCFASEANCTAPIIKQLSACPSSLWPPNHKMKQVAIDYKVKSNCGPVTSWLTVKSNESITGTCRGDLSPDWLIVDDHHLLLRAERAGRGRGRIYTITVNSKDAYGNMATATTQVTVAHRRKSSARGVNDGAGSREGYIDANGDYFDQVFDCSVTPNPSTQNFNLQVISASDEKIEIALFDMSGKLISKTVAFKNKTIRFGQELRPGVYMVEVKQGAQHKTVRLVKQ